jgi:hypothetical protein
MKTASLCAGILALAGSMAVPVSSQASSVQVVFVSHDGYRPSAYRVGYGRGYDDGLREGAHDARRREAFSFWDEKRYLRCGYHSSYGPRQDYHAGYRLGFEGGYREGYRATYRCAFHHRVGCTDRRCQPAYRSRYSHVDDDWASRDDRDEDGHRDYREER